MKILIIDDDFFVRTALQTIIESQADISVVALGADGEEAISLYKLHRPDVLLMDIRMQAMDGLTAGSKILESYPEAKILYLTTFSDDEYIIKALRMGAKGYLIKQHFDAIVPALRAVFTGQRVFGDEVATKLPQLLQQDHRSDMKHIDLSEREQEVLTEVANGLSNKEIAERLFLSEGTIRNYISTLLEKLDLRDRTQLAIFYYKHYRGL